MTKASYEEFDIRLSACESAIEVNNLMAEAERIEAQEGSEDPIDRGRFTSFMESATMVRSIFESPQQA